MNIKTGFDQVCFKSRHRAPQMRARYLPECTN